MGNETSYWDGQSYTLPHLNFRTMSASKGHKGWVDIEWNGPKQVRLQFIKVKECLHDHVAVANTLNIFRRIAKFV